VRAAKLRLEAQQARVGATRAAALPAIALIGKGFFTGDTLREFLRGGSLSGFLASQFTLPILNQERNRGRLEEARAEFSVAQEDFSGVVIRAFGECRDAVSAAEAAQSILRYREELQCRRKESLDAASRRRAAGLLGRLTILPLEDALFDAEKETVKARLTLLDAQVQLALTLALGAPTQTGSSRPSDAKPIQLREKIRAESLHPIHEKH